MSNAFNDNDVLCADCGVLLDTVPNVPLELRQPCPQCGSLKRNYINVVPTLSVNLTGGASTLNAVATVSAHGISNMLLQAIVIPGAKSPQGHLITAIAPAWRTIIDVMEKDPSAAFRFDSRQWEEIIAGAYSQAGFDEVILTPRSGDLGRDIIAVKHGLWSVRIIDQVKAYGPGHRVPANDVRALIGVLLSDPQASKGLVTTTAEFAPKVESDPFIAPYIPHRLELVDGKQLIKRLRSIADGDKV